jgi:hypothetical protein
VGGRIRPFIILVVIPLLLSFTVLAVPPNPSDEIYLFIPTGLYIYVSIGYGLYAIRQRNDKYFKRKKPEDLIGEREFIKKVVYIAIFPLIIIFFILIAVYFAVQPFITLYVLMILSILLNVSFGPLVGGLIRLLIQSRNGKFGYHFAKAYFQIGTNEEDNTKKMNYLIKGIKAYDKYLRNLGIQIDTKRIYSNIMCDPSIDENKATNTFSESFNNEQDKLKPIKSVSEIANIKETENILNEISKGQRIKDIAGFFAAIGAIVGLFLTTLQLLQSLSGP